MSMREIMVEAIENADEVLGGLGEKHPELMVQLATAAMIAESLDGVARAVHMLGNGDAATSMGGLEALGGVMKEELSGLAAAASEIAQAISDR